MAARERKGVWGLAEDITDFIFSLDLLLVRRGEDRRGQAPLVRVDRISDFFFGRKKTTTRVDLPGPYDDELTKGRTDGRMSWPQASRKFLMLPKPIHCKTSY
jgi:hypothetical protein